MFPEERQKKILELLIENGKVFVKDLAQMFDVTEDSIRKDLGNLETEGKLKRTYGGAVVVKEKLQPAESEKRRIRDVEAKRKIAAAAVKLINPGELIFLDISTISIAMAEILARSENQFRVITNMIDVLVILARNPKIEVVFAGGKLGSERDGFYDSLNMNFLSNFRPEISFVGTVGADFLKNSLTSNDAAKGIHKAQILNLSKSAYIIAESRKIGFEGTYKYAGFENVNGLVTEISPSREILKAAKNLNVEIILPTDRENSNVK